MKNLQNKEHLMYFMQSGVLRLSNYDLKFLKNIHLLTVQQKSITSNQKNLFEKLIYKYKRQLLKHNFSYEFCQLLEYTSTIVQSESQFTDAFISIKDNKIILKSPFNKKFLQELNSLYYNPYKWIVDEKNHEAEYSTYNLKLLVSLVSKHYNQVHYCDRVQSLINIIAPFNNVKVWNPTLHKIKNFYFVAGINKHLENVVKEINFDSDIKTLSLCHEFGIGIDKSVTDDTEKIKFANNFTYEVSIENLGQVIDWLKELGCDCIYFTGKSGPYTSKDVRNKFLEVTNNHFDINYQQEVKYKYPIAVSFFKIASVHKINSLNIKRNIKIINSNPIDLK